MLRWELSKHVGINERVTIDFFVTRRGARRFIMKSMRFSGVHAPGKVLDHEEKSKNQTILVFVPRVYKVRPV